MTAWIVAAVVVWLIVAAGVALVIGRAVRQRERQIPTPPTGVPAVPRPRSAFSAAGADRVGDGAPGSGGRPAAL
jgi:hypothetical protein